MDSIAYHSLALTVKYNLTWTSTNLLCVLTFLASIHKRHLKGSERQDVAAQCDNREAVAVHREKLAAMTQGELIAGNITSCQTPATIRKA